MTEPDSKSDETRDVGAALEDFRQRSLCHVEGNLAKLVYLSSCRDYNSGKYRHDGLATRFSETVVHQALARCHRELFEQMIRSPLAVWVDELRSYFKSTDPESLKVWKQLRPYQIAVPLGTARLAAELFTANLKIALEILESERKKD